jgi:uncharacterized protein YigA (DUF484 family)
MDGISTTRSQPNLSPAQTVREQTRIDLLANPKTRQFFPNNHPDSDFTASRDVPEQEQTVTCFQERDPSQLLRSFDRLFRIQQRSEEIRGGLAKIDGILLKSRTVAGLIEEVIGVLVNELYLASVRVLFPEAHPLAPDLTDCLPLAVGTIPAEVVKSHDYSTDKPFVLDDPSGDLAKALFGESSPLVRSAVVAGLGPELGLLCLGSADPSRYFGGMNTDLIATLAEKLTLGIQNAWDHETRSQRVLGHSGIYSASFFHEYLDKELNRAWRYHTTFCLLALSWKNGDKAVLPDREEIAKILLKHIRCADVLSLGESANLWILMPETDLRAAQIGAERIICAVRDLFGDALALHIGLTGFSKSATFAGLLTRHARMALDEAAQHPISCAVVREIALPES